MDLKFLVRVVSQLQQIQAKPQVQYAAVRSAIACSLSRSQHHMERLILYKMKSQLKSLLLSSKTYRQICMFYYFLLSPSATVILEKQDQS